MPSQRNRQASLLESGFLDLLGTDKLEYGPIALGAIEDALLDLAVQFQQKAIAKLHAADRTASGELEDSIQPTEVSIFGKVYQISLNINDYFRYVDLGVKGWQNEKAGNTPYQFKKGGIGPKSPMVIAIRKWLIREGLKGKGRENKTGSRRDKKRNSIADTSTRAAIGISQGIRKKGLKGSRFWTETRNEMVPIVQNELGKALKIDIITNLTNTK